MTQARSTPVRDTAASPDIWHPERSVDVDAVNADLEVGKPTVDVAIYYPSNLDPAHHELVNPELLFDGFDHARRVFDAAGVQLRLAKFATGTIDPQLFSLRSAERGRDLPSSRFANMYRHAERTPAIVSDAALRLFDTVIGDAPGNDLVVHIVALQSVYIEWHESVVEERVYQSQLIETGGLSFPGYMHGDTMPRGFRGAITITNLTRTKDSWKTIAHELGHKLLNVSHEHRGVSPQHEVLSDEGLMLYGQGTEIASGPEGRYHLERLHRSPFIYRESIDGSRTHMPDYAADGFYYDPIYDGVCVEF